MDSSSNQQEKRTPSNLYFFLLGLALVVASPNLVYLVGIYSIDPYGSDDQVRPFLVHELPARDAVFAKEVHAASRTPYDIGLFGNSRAVTVGGQHLDLESSDQFFNFGVGGISFTTSVLQLERLAHIGVAPKLAIISFDHPAIPHPQRAPALPDVFTFATAWRGLAGSLDDEDPYAAHHRDVLMSGFIDYLLSPLNGKMVTRRARYLLGRYRFDSREDYPIDGSRKEGNWGDDRQYVIPGGHNPSAPALGHLFAKLARLSETGTRIVIYESPLHPDVLEHFAGGFPAAIEQRRLKFRRLCAGARLECFDTLTLPQTGDGKVWEDFSHPPATVLGEHIRTLLFGSNIVLAN